MPSRTHSFIDSPIGTITLVNLDSRLCGLYMSPHKHGPRKGDFGERAHFGFEQAAKELREYFDGNRTVFEVPLHFEGTSFQKEVWSELCAIPFGETRTYGQIAAKIGRPKAVRAVGHANGHNPISIIAPCHRVIGSDGSLIGYGGGLDRKKFLLGLEGAWSEPQLALAIGN